MVGSKSNVNKDEVGTRYVDADYVEHKRESNVTYIYVMYILFIKKLAYAN